MDASVTLCSVGSTVSKQHRDEASGYLKAGSPDLLPCEEKKCPPAKAKQEETPVVAAPPLAKDGGDAAPTKPAEELPAACTGSGTKLVPPSTTQRQGWGTVVLCTYAILFGLLACTVLTILDKPGAATVAAPDPGFVALLLFTIFLIVAAAVQVQKAANQCYEDDAGPKSVLKQGDVSEVCSSPHKRRISFGNVEIREHELMVGGSGVVITDGAPLGLGWGISTEYSFAINEFEAERDPVRRQMDNFVQEGWVSPVERERRLLDGGVHPRDVEKISKVHACTQRLRARSNEVSLADRSQRRVLRFKWREKLMLPARSPKRRQGKARKALASEWAG